MQTTRVNHGLGKWILRDGFGECVESEDVNMRLETTALVDLGGKLLGKTGEVLFGTLTYGVATLNICPYLPCPNAFEGGNKFLHRKRIVATDIDAPEKGDVCIHSDRTRVHVIRRPTSKLSGPSVSGGPLESNVGHYEVPDLGSSRTSLPRFS